MLATYTTRIEADRGEAPVLLSNGDPIERGTLEGGKRHYAVWRDPHPKPSYLFALVGGNLASYASDFTTASGRKVDLRIYVEPGKESRCAWAMDALKRSMRWDEERFGREYDLNVFNIVAVSDFNMGAMENKGLNIFNDGLILASPETATDASFAAIERVIAHEYFHNWTGNRITCRDWFQLCLKEGLTVFRDQEFCADQRSATVERIRDVRNLKAAQFPEDAGPLAHPVRPGRYIEINNFYTATVYNKGAELVRMIQTLLGRDGFRRGMDLYFERHDGQAATVEDFVACFEDATGKDLGQFMTWYSQAGTPELVCQLKYDARSQDRRSHDHPGAAADAGRAEEEAAAHPCAAGPLGRQRPGPPARRWPPGQRLEDGLVEVRKRAETFRFRDVPSRPVPSLLRGFSAPVNLTIDLADADLQFLMANDSDLYNRWQAAQDYATRVLVDAVKAIRAGKRPAKPSAFVARARRDAAAMQASSPAIAPSSCSCRARAIWPGSSPAMWTRSPSTRRARRCARPSAQPTTGRWPRHIATTSPRGPIRRRRRRPASARCAMRRSAISSAAVALRTSPGWLPISPTPATPPTR